MKTINFTLLLILLVSEAAIAQKFEWADIVFLAGRTEEANDNEISTATDLQGNIFITGKFKEEVIVTSEYVEKKGGKKLHSSQPITSLGGDDIFLAKFNDSGILEWATSFGGTGTDIGKAIACNSNGDIIITGQFEGTVDFGGTSLTASRANNIFVAVYDNDGSLLWAQRAGGVTVQPVIETGTGVAIDGSDNIYITGTFFGGDDQGDYSVPGSATFGDYQVINAVQATNSFVTKYSRDGIVQWVQTIGHYGLGGSNGICVDESGNSYITGVCAATFVVGKDVKKSNGLTDIYVAKINADGTHNWFKQFGSGDQFNPANAAKYNDPFEAGAAICSDNEGNIYVTGQFSDKCAFGSFELKIKKNMAIFLLKMNTDGNVEWASKTGGKKWEFAKAVVYDGNGNVYISGINSKYGGMDIEKSSSGGVLTTTMEARGIGFVEKYNVKKGKLDWGAPAGSWGFSLAANPDHHVYLVGSFANQVKFGKKKLNIKGKLKSVKKSGGGFFNNTSRTKTSYEAGFGLYMVKITK